MSIERHTEHTGIFSRESTKATGPDLGAVLSEWAEKHNDLWEHWLDWAEAAADAVLADAKAPANARRDAVAARACCRMLREHLDKGDIHGAAYEAFLLGLATARMQVRPAEPNARLGGQVREGRRQGHIVAHGSREQKERRWALYQQLIDRLSSEHVDWSHWRLAGEASRLLADKGHVVTGRTIYEHTRIPRR